MNTNKIIIDKGKIIFLITCVVECEKTQRVIVKLLADAG